MVLFMMLKPSTKDILKSGESYYSLVVAVAKRARQIAQQAEESGEILIEKPVQLAVEEFGRGEYKLVESPHLGEETEE